MLLILSSLISLIRRPLNILLARSMQPFPMTVRTNQFDANIIENSAKLSCTGHGSAWMIYKENTVFITVECKRFTMFLMYSRAPCI